LLQQSAIAELGVFEIRAITMHHHDAVKAACFVNAPHLLLGYDRDLDRP
jgi:hypothetical protein